MASTYACLLINGFVGFQFAEDGTPLSLWVRMRHAGENVPRLTQRFSFITPVLADLLPGGFRRRVLYRHRHFQTIRRIQLCEAHRLMDHLHFVASDLHCGLHRLAAYPRIPNS